MLTVSPITVNHKKRPTFGQMAAKLPKRTIKSGLDAINQWELLRHPKYSAIFQEEETCTQAQREANRQLRLNNYSFLDDLRYDFDKKQFIDYFKSLTGFPSLTEVSRNILAEFKRVIGVADKKARSFSLFGSGDNILMCGYDEFCSVGQKTALPGSDLDKGYAILREVRGGLREQKRFSDEVKGQIWENIDNRILSVNHTAAFPNIMTDKELAENIHYVDRYARQFVTPENINFFRYIRLQKGNPISGSKFNIWLSDRLPCKQDKYNAKNLAYIVEAMRDGKKLSSQYTFNESLYKLFENSEFCHCSNVTQGKVMQDRYDYSVYELKDKLKARKEVEQSFNSWSTSKQYELVKDIIRSMSGDSINPEFKPLFYSHNDRPRLLINDILRGKVGCTFEETKYGERAAFDYKENGMRERYQDLNIYDADY